jgi:SAM-dependent MidA family methyltransferase
MSPSEMGELFKAIAFTRDVNQPLIGFAAGDRRAAL